MTEAQDRQALADGHKAKAELLLTEAAFAKVRAAMVDKLISTSVDQQHLREKLYFALQSCDAVQKALMDVVQSGEIAEVALANTNYLLRP